MKWHVIAVVLIIAALFPEEILTAKRPTFKSRRNKVNFKISKPRNDPARRLPTSTAVTSYNPRTSQFRPIHNPSAGPSSHPAPVPSSPSSRFARLRLSSNSQPTRNPASSSSVPHSGNNVTPTVTGGSRNTIRNRFSNPQNTARQQQPSTSGKTSRRASLIIPKRRIINAPRPTLQQLRHAAMNPQSPPLAPNPRANPPPLPPFRYPPLPPVQPRQAPVNHPPANPPPAPVNNNPTPRPSGSQRSAPAALIQAGSAPAPGSRAASRAQKAQDRADKIAKSQAKAQAKAQATLQQIQANAGTCKDKTAPPEKCFDFFVLSVAWGPTMKIANLGIGAPINKPEWGVHGLWPSLNTYHKLPKQCNLPIPYDPNKLSTLEDDLEDRWFSANGSPMTHQALWRHQWEKHGSCAARSPQLNDIKAYFHKGLELFNQGNIQAKLNAAGFRPKKEMTNKDMHDEISRILGHRITLDYVANPEKPNESWLSEIRLCYDFKFQLMHCPPYSKTLRPENEDMKIVYSV